MRLLIIISIILILSADFKTGMTMERDKYESHVITLSVTYQTYNQHNPWVKNKPLTRTAQAVVIDDSKILTTASMVADATLIQAKKHGKSQKFSARIIQKDMELNLALLTVDKKGFYDDLSPASLARTLITQGNIKSVRWKDRQLEISTSRINRIEVLRPGNTRSVEYAVIRATTDLSSGGMAEPVFIDGELLGLTVSQSNQLASILPAELILSYLKAVKQDEYPGFATMGIGWQYHRDPAVASWLGQKGDIQGVLIRNVAYGETGDDVLQPKDVLLEIDGHVIDTDGYYTHPVYGQLRYTNILSDGHMIGDKLPIKVFRDRMVLDLEMELKGFPADIRLIPYRRSDHSPPYLVAGGFVFRELDYNYLRSAGKNWRSRTDLRLVTYWDLERGAQSPDRKRIIILSKVLPDSYNIGYHNLRDLVVKQVNGYEINSIHDLEKAFSHPDEGFHTIIFRSNFTRNRVVLDSADFERSTERIMNTYNIPDRIRLKY